MKPRGRINSPEKCRAAREYLGLSKAELARVLRMASRDSVRLAEIRGPTGPYQVALEALVAGWRPWGVKLPIDDSIRKGHRQWIG